MMCFLAALQEQGEELAAVRLKNKMAGLVEVNMLNESFTGIYGDVTYTVGIRSGCEPMLYAFLLIIIELYIRVMPQTEKCG